MNYKDEIKAIAFDFDGTLIDFNYNATSYTRDALNILKDSKYKVCLSSGRPCFLAKKAFTNTFGEYPLDYIFGCNGSEFEDCKNNVTTLLYSLKKDEVIDLARLLKNDLFTVCVYNGEEFLVDKQIDDPELIEWLNARWLKPVLFDFEKNEAERSKILILNKKADRQKEDLFVGTIKDKLSNFNYAYSSPNCLEIAPKGVSKAKSVEKLAELLNCSPKQILSFGDMANDMPMLLNSTGVIMDNASDELKAQIELHTSRVDKLGVYDFLHSNGLI